MTDQKPTAGELLTQIATFEETLSVLQKNVIDLRKKIIKNRDQYGEEVSSWPKL